jgi:hypothetical protein
LIAASTSSTIDRAGSSIAHPEPLGAVLGQRSGVGRTPEGSVKVERCRAVADVAPAP